MNNLINEVLINEDLINEELRLKEKIEIELNVEYYFDFIGIDKSFNGICKIIRIFRDSWSWSCLVNKIDNGVTFMICKFDSSYNILGQFNTPGLKYLGCRIYKIPTTEYILK
jgi:hypothetical protein